MSQIGFNRNNTTADVGADVMASVLKAIIPTSGIVDVFDDLACARINDNLVRLSPGVYNLSGYFVVVKPGTTEDLVVDSGTPGYNRIDLVVAEFVRNGGGAGVDTLQFKIVKGTSTTGTPADPTLTADDVNIEANTTRQEALYRLTITGTTLAAPVLLATVLDNLASVVAMLALKAPLASPALTGTPTAPTASVGTNTTQLATTAFVNAEIANDAFLKTANASIGVTNDSTNANTYNFLTGMTLVGSYTSNMPLASEYWIVQCMKFDSGARTMFASALTSKKTFVRTQEAGTWGAWNPINIVATGAAPIYACRAWVNCAGVGGTIYGSGNVSSVAHDAQGVWTVNFATALPDANYAIVGTTRYDGTVLTLGQYLTTKSTTQTKIIVRNNSGVATNPDQMSIAIFR